MIQTKLDTQPPPQPSPAVTRMRRLVYRDPQQQTAGTAPAVAGTALSSASHEQQSLPALAKAETLSAKNATQRPTEPLPPLPMKGTPRDPKPISDADLYILEWAQTRRTVARCKFWFDPSRPVLPGDIGCTEEEHHITVSNELQNVCEQIHGLPLLRLEFVQRLNNAVLNQFEGPRGLGTTTKDEFEAVLIDLVIDMSIHLDPTGFDFFFDLKQYALASITAQLGMANTRKKKVDKVEKTVKRAPQLYRPRAQRKLDPPLRSPFDEEDETPKISRIK